MRRRSLTTRLTLSHTLVTLAALVLLSAVLIGLVWRGQRAQALESLTAQAQISAAFAADIAADTNTLAAVGPSLVRRFSIAPGTDVRLFGPNGAVLFASRDLGLFPSAAVRDLLPDPLPIQPIAPQANRRFVAQPIVRGDQTIGVIELSQSVERQRAQINELLAALLPGVGLALVGAALAGYALAIGLARPLHRLGHVATEIAGGSIDARSDDRSADEIGQLAQRLNAMADQLQARLDEIERLSDARQQFYRSVSHELRTPLTAIRAAAENLDDDATPDQQAALEIVHGESLRLQRLVEELLQPRDSLPAPLRRRQPVDVGDLVAEACRIMRPRADRSGITIDDRVEANLWVSGDCDRLKQALLNLLDNAVTWTPPGGAVTLRAARDGDSIALTISDTGGGIDPALGERIWERGVSGSGGQGLGLALVRDVAVAHGGSATIRDPGSATIEIRLPIGDRSGAASRASTRRATD